MDISFWGSPFNPLHHVKERRKEFLDSAQSTESLGGVGEGRLVLGMAWSTEHKVVGVG